MTPEELACIRPGMTVKWETWIGEMSGTVVSGGVVEDTKGGFEVLQRNGKTVTVRAEQIIAITIDTAV